MSRSKRGRVLLTSLATTAILAVPVASAAATTNPADTAVHPLTDHCKSLYYQGEYRGMGCFFAYGDRVSAYDADPDGAHIRVDWHTDYGRDGACDDGGDRDGDLCDYNMRESGRLKFQVELRNGHKLIAATDWTRYLSIS